MTLTAEASIAPGAALQRGRPLAACTLVAPGPRTSPSARGLVLVVPQRAPLCVRSFPYGSSQRSCQLPAPALAVTSGNSSHP